MISSNNYPNKIYIDLDSILDTRMGLIASIDTDKATRVLSNNYHDRRLDLFEGFTVQEFKDLYKERTSDILPYSLLTEVFSIIDVCIKEALIENLKGGQNDGYEVILNTYPYELDDEEIQEIKYCITDMALGYTIVDTIHKSNDELTPLFFKDNFCMIIKYDYADWITIHQEILSRKPIPGILMIGPALFHDREPDETEIREMRKQNLNPFKVLELTMAPLVGLKIVDARVFSIDKRILEEAKKENKQA